MKYSKYHSIVLKRVVLDEKYALISLFTKEEGILDVKARGLQKTTSKLAPKLEPGFESVVGIYEVAPGQLIVTSVDAIAPLVFFEENFETMKIRFMLLELYAKIIPKEVQEERLFALFQKARIVFMYTQKPLTVYYILIIKLLVILGYIKEVRHCIECGKHLGEEAYISLHSFEASFLCSTCPTPPYAARTEVNVIKAIAYYADNDFLDGLLLSLEQDTEKKLENVLHGFITNILGKPLESFAL